YTFKCEHKFARRVSSAAYTIYLFHHSIVIVLGIAAITLGLNIHVAFLGIVILTFYLTLQIHRKISSSPLLLLLFNGQPLSLGGEQHPNREKAIVLVKHLLEHRAAIGDVNSRELTDMGRPIVVGDAH